jgi:hypothetical protein
MHTEPESANLRTDMEVGCLVCTAYLVRKNIGFRQALIRVGLKAEVEFDF